MTTEELMELMEERALGYRFLARAFRTAPDPTFIEAVMSASEANADGPLAPFYSETDDADREQLRIDLAADYNQLFLGMSAHPAAPYESVYTSEEGLMMQDARDNVLHTYQQWGLRVPDEFDLPEDHITLEFDLMACLADRTRTTLEADEDAASRTEEGDVCSASELIAAQRAFLDEHLSWVPAFCGDVEKHARTAFYYGIAGLTRQQLEADRETLRSI